MRATSLLLTGLLLSGPTVVRAQAEYFVRVGASGASDLVQDRFLTDVQVRQSIAPMVALGGSLPLGSRGYRAGVEATVTTGSFHSRESNANTGLGTLRTGSVLVSVEGPISTGVRWRLGVGGVQYWPADREGIFHSGGPLRLLGGAGVDYRRSALAHWDLMVSARYDLHRFTTDELKSRGFSQAQGVGRISLSLGLSRSVR
jgi:hypothetical protein